VTTPLSGDLRGLVKELQSAQEFLESARKIISSAETRLFVAAVTEAARELAGD
jgi:hypothetical protein